MKMHHSVLEKTSFTKLLHTALANCLGNILTVFISMRFLTEGFNRYNNKNYNKSSLTQFANTGNGSRTISHFH